MVSLGAAEEPLSIAAQESSSRVERTDIIFCLEGGNEDVQLSLSLSPAKQHLIKADSDVRC